MGVDVFFVLSGYLITGILLDTLRSPNYYRNFICRRALRIFPLYYACLGVFTAATALGPLWSAFQRWGGAGWFVAYLGNVRAAWIGAQPPVFSFSPLWSLQVEEQFYLLYPALILFFSIANVRRILIACVCVAPLLRLLLYVSMPGNIEARYSLMPSRMDALAIGGLVALLARSPKTRLRQTTIRAGLTGGIGILVAICVVAGTDRGPLLMSTLGYSTTAATSAFTLISVLFWPQGTLAACLRSKPLAYIGQISYGLYLLHAPASWAARSIIGRLLRIRIDGHSDLSVPITFASAFVVASLSWRFFETPFLRLKNRFTVNSQAIIKFSLPPI
jgi:peptidoglycan/LPS O-acetylase OafA/YrhL